MDYIKAGLDAQAAAAGLVLCRTCGFTHEPSPDGCPRWAPEQPAEQPKANALLNSIRAALADYDRYTELPLVERTELHRLPEFAGRFAAILREVSITYAVEQATRTELVWCDNYNARGHRDRHIERADCRNPHNAGHPQTAQEIWAAAERFSASDFAASRAAGDD